MKVVVGSASKELGECLSNKPGINESLVQISRYADNEINVGVTRDLFNQEVCVVQSTSSPVNDNLMELLLIVDSMKRVGAKKITAIIPYYGYSRQDRVIKDGHISSALSAKLVANMIETAGVNRVVVVDLHSSQIEGFFNIPVDNLSCFEAFIDCVEKKDLAIVAPDVGAIGRARSFARSIETRYNIELGDKIVVVDKYREQAGVSQVMNVIGEVANKNCIIVDDIVDSGGTLCNAAAELKNRGAKSVVACITHGVLSGNAVEKINSSALDKLIITDTIFSKFAKDDKIEVVSIANVLTHFILEAQGDNHAH